MKRLRGFVSASHAPPTIAVTAVMGLFAWNIGWSGMPLALVCLAILVGQLSVGWSNDAFDSSSDVRAGRSEKPTVAGLVSPRALWVFACAALLVSSVLSWAVAGIIGGSIHVFALAMAWLYNVALSRTVWSWLPYALAFGVMPQFLFVGLDGDLGPWWTVAVFALVAVSAHLANALKDLDTDRSAGIDGLVVRLGARWSTLLCWLLLGTATGLLVVVATAHSAAPWTATVLIVGFLAAVLFGSRSRRSSAMFLALLGVALLDVGAVTLAPVL
ncbi:MAG: UbiA family prenyltransferase [Actinomycetes bacterium]